MRHFINLEDISTKNLRKILVDAKKRKKNREKKQGPDLQMPQQQRLGTRGRQSSRGKKE